MKKNLYLFLSSLLGCLLFLIIHHAGLAVYDFIVGNPYSHVGFPPPAGNMWLISLLAFGVAGLIYGLYVGKKWYKFIYEKEVIKKLEQVQDSPEHRVVRIKPNAGKRTVIPDSGSWDLDDLKKVQKQLKVAAVVKRKDQILTVKPVRKTATSQDKPAATTLVAGTTKVASKTIKSAKLVKKNDKIEIGPKIKKSLAKSNSLSGRTKSASSSSKARVPKIKTTKVTVS